jgi:hypothetical protein
VEAFLIRRAERVLDRLRSRSPAVTHILALAGGVTWLGRFVLLLAFAAGVSLSALDGSRRINILAFPLIGLIAWNLLVYVLLFVTWIRSRGRPATGFWSAAVYERWIASRIESLMRHSTRYNVPLTTGLRRFGVGEHVPGSTQRVRVGVGVVWARLRSVGHCARVTRRNRRIALDCCGWWW